MWLINLKNLSLMSFLLMFFYFVFSYLNSDIEDFGDYQFEYVRDKGWPADYILVQKIKEGSQERSKLLFGLVINFYQEKNYVYFSYIEGENIASQSCYLKKEISYGKINIQNQSLEIIDKNYFLKNQTLPKKTKVWLEDSNNRC